MRSGVLNFPPPPPPPPFFFVGGGAWGLHLSGELVLSGVGCTVVGPVGVYTVKWGLYARGLKRLKSKSRMRITHVRIGVPWQRGACAIAWEKDLYCRRAQNFGAGGMRSFEHRVEARRGVVACLPIFRNGQISMIS